MVVNAKAVPDRFHVDEPLVPGDVVEWQFPMSWTSPVWIDVP